MKAHIIMHESFEAPGAIKTWCIENNIDIEYSRLYLGDKLPISVNGFDMLFVMGGPQSPATSVNECAHFNAAEEILFIKSAIDNTRAVLGVCLGAQLIGEALGAKYDHSPNREIGVYDLHLTDDAKSDPYFSTLPETFPCGHWHGDMPGLTESSKILAYSKGCPRQIVKYTDKVYGFQCHFEFDNSCIEAMIENCADELQEYKGLPYVASSDQLRSQDYTEINDKLFKFLDYLSSKIN